MTMKDGDFCERGDERSVCGSTKLVLSMLYNLTCAAESFVK
jgi:hypothetical protein